MHDTITHHVCNRTSHNPNDVAAKYCGFCHKWLEPGEYTVQRAG